MNIDRFAFVQEEVMGSRIGEQPLGIPQSTLFEFQHADPVCRCDCPFTVCTLGLYAVAGRSGGQTYNQP